MPITILPEVNLRGNTNGNIINGGFAALQGDWIYYTKKYENAIYKTNRFTLEDEYIPNSNYAYYINVIGNWIFYVNVNEGERIYKICLNGKEKICLTDEKCATMHVINDWIYYINKDDNWSIYKIKVDGSKKEKLNSNNSRCLNISENWIYYANGDDKWNVYRIPFNGKENELVIKNVSTFNVEEDRYYGETIYFIDGSQDICSYNFKNNYISKVVSAKCTVLNVIGDWIYYGKSSDRGFSQILSKIHIHGYEEKSLNREGNCINVVGDWIYYNRIFHHNIGFDFISIEGCTNPEIHEA